MAPDITQRRGENGTRSVRRGRQRRQRSLWLALSKREKRAGRLLLAHCFFLFLLFLLLLVSRHGWRLVCVTRDSVSADAHTHGNLRM
ncbi:hypothetical protein GQ53DRAFT_21379 [Thozetella sp. PMI_491]|nr:hypothetical protein GQ53DRAFT_21379 [Thozetella sp. PMI_491]